MARVRYAPAAWLGLISLCLAAPLFAAGPSEQARPPLLAATPNQPLTFTVGAKVRVADVTREGMKDADISLRSFPGWLRGHVGAEPVQLRLEPRRVEGTLGNQPVGLDVIRSGDGLEVAGTFGSRAVAMEIRRQGIEARIGPCDYRLPFSLGHYRGVVTCGGAPASVDLTVPVALVARDDRELAAMLTALFAR